MVSIAIPKNASDTTEGFYLQMDYPKLNGSNWNIFATDYSEDSLEILRGFSGNLLRILVFSET
jgi:hypothetical protein